ncbi:PP0621 family protein [Methylophaga thiooxydans]|uniref:PP0621 family protein n=1 Tax=Methylophaga thiooxydans TaxID=392484 RepID=UPI00030122D6|nr:PP0621 family protein [Methylophaga thiooxydans]
MRILVLLAIGLLLYIIISNLLRKAKQSPITSTKSERMVRCEHCGLHIIEQEALEDNRQYFCSNEHLEEHRQSR